MRYISTLLLAFSKCLVSAAGASNLRGSEESAGTIDCRITVFHTSYLTKQGKKVSNEDTVCIPIVNGQESHHLFPYHIQVPATIRRQYEYELSQGIMYVSIANASFKDDSILTTEASDFIVHKQQYTQRLLDKAFNQTVGRRTLAVVTVSTINGQRVSYSPGKLRKHLFLDEHSMKRQYQRCSLHQIDWESAGFYHVILEGDIADYGSPANARNMALQKLVDDKVVEKSAQELGDYVMVILPQGSLGFIANAGMNYWLSTFNDVWSLDLLTVIHELGHCAFGLGHAGWESAKYGDFSSYMSSSGKQPRLDGPSKCFNGAEFDQLGWFAHRTMRMQVQLYGQKVEIAAFPHADRENKELPLLVDIDEHIVLVYNRADGFNNETMIFRNMVTASKNGQGNTTILGGVSPSSSTDLIIPRYNEEAQPLRIQACQALTGDTENPDSMIISFGYSHRLCDTTEKPKNSKKVDSSGDSEATPDSMATKATPDSMATKATPDSMATNATPDSMATEATPDSMETEATPDSMATEATSPVSGSSLPAPLDKIIQMTESTRYYPNLITFATSATSSTVIATTTIGPTVPSSSGSATSTTSMAIPATPTTDSSISSSGPLVSATSETSSTLTATPPVTASSFSTTAETDSSPEDNRRHPMNGEDKVENRHTDEIIRTTTASMLIPSTTEASASDLLSVEPEAQGKDCPPTGSLLVGLLQQGQVVPVRCNKIISVDQRIDYCPQINQLNRDSGEKVYQVCQSECSAKCVRG